MNAPDCDEPTVYVLLTVPKIGFEPPPGATGSLAEERAKVSKRGKSDPKHQRVLRRVGHFIQEAWVERGVFQTDPVRIWRAGPTAGQYAQAHWSLGIGVFSLSTPSKV